VETVTFPNGDPPVGGSKIPSTVKRSIDPLANVM